MTATVGSIQIALEADASKLISGFDRAGRSITAFGTRSTRATSIAEARMVRLRTVALTTASTFSRFAAVAGLGGFLSVAGLSRFADGFTRINNALKVAGLSGSELKGTLADLFAIAQRNGTAIEPLVTLYSRLAQTQKELGASGRELLDFTEGIAVALRVAGSDSTQAAGALLQLSQALGSSVVRAEEFNSVNEGARPILQAVANGLQEAGGSVSKLRSLVIKGEVSNTAFFRAFLAGIGDMKAQAATATPTVAQGFTTLNNALIALVGSLDSMAGASVGASSGLVALATGISNLARDEDKLRTMVDLAERLAAAFVGLKVGKIFGPIGAAVGAGVGFMEPEIRRALTGPPPLSASSKILPGGAPILPSGLSSPSAASAPTVSLAQFPVSISSADDKAIARRTDAWKRETRAIMERAESLRLEASLVGKSTFETARLETAHELLTRAQRDGAKVTDEQRQQIDALSTSFAAASVALEDARNRQQQLIDLQQTFGDVALDVFDRLAISGDDFNDVLADTLRALARLVAQAALLGQGPLAGLFGGAAPSGGGLGGLFGAIFGGFAGGGGAAAGATFGSAIPSFLYHGGGSVGDGRAPSRLLTPMQVASAPRFHGGLGAGELAAVLQVGENVLTKDMSRRTADTISGLSLAARDGGTTVSVNYAPSYSVTGSGPEIDKLRQQMAEDQASFQGRVVEALRTVNSRRVKT